MDRQADRGAWTVERGATARDREAGSAKDHRELRVYQLASKCALRMHELSKKFPPEERYSLTDQIRRASRSVCTNIAEAWRKRRYPSHFLSKLSDADMEAGEARVWLEFCQHFRYTSQGEYAELVEDYDHICGQLGRMMAQPDAWVPPASDTLRSTVHAPRSTRQ